MTFSRGDITKPIDTAYALWSEAHLNPPYPMDPIFLPRFEWRMSPDIYEALIAAVPGGMTYPASVLEQRLLGCPVAVDETLPPGWMQLDVDDPGPG